MTQRAHWHILGAGAIGCLWAALWDRAGQTSTLITRQQTCKKGLILHSGNKHSTHNFSCKTVSSLSQPIDYLLITTKAQQTRQAFAQVQHLLSDDAIIVVLQNGMAATQLSVIPGQQLYAATTTEGAHFSNEKNLHHIGPGKTLYGKLNTPHCELNRSLLPPSIDIHYCSDIEQKLRQKLAINCAINALACKHQCRNGLLISEPKIHAEFVALCEEIKMITTGLGWGGWFDNVEKHAEEVAINTAENINSTLQDIQRGKRSEIGELNGYLCQLAQAHNIASPMNDALFASVLAMENNPA